MKPFQKKFLSGLLVIAIFTFLPVYSDGGITEEAIQRKVYVEMKAGKKRAFLNEKVPLTVKLYAAGGYPLKDIQYPQLHHKDFSIEEFEAPVQKNERLNGIEFETLEFRTVLFGKRPGEFRLGPVRLQCTLLVQRNEGTDAVSPASKADRYFGAPEAYPLILVSNEMPLGILPLPERGKPRGFDGAVGNFRISVEVYPKEVKIGEPITLKVTVEGEGNLNTIGPPEIEPKPGFKIYEPQAEQKESIKIYEQVLVPQSETSREIPEVRFSFFDPGKGSYQTIRKGPIAIKVRKNEGEEESTTGKKLGPGTPSGGKAGLERDLVPVKKAHGRLKKNFMQFSICFPSSFFSRYGYGTNKKRKFAPIRDMPGSWRQAGGQERAFGKENEFLNMENRLNSMTLYSELFRSISGANSIIRRSP